MTQDPPGGFFASKSSGIVSKLAEYSEIIYVNTINTGFYGFHNFRTNFRFVIDAIRCCEIKAAKYHLICDDTIVSQNVIFSAFLQIMEVIIHSFHRVIHIRN